MDFDHPATYMSDSDRGVPHSCDEASEVLYQNHGPGIHWLQAMRWTKALAT